MIIQNIEKSYRLFDVARMYYSVLFVLNDLPVAEKELNLVAFTALNGTISTPSTRDRFVEEFGSSRNSIYNMSSKLQGLGIFVKDGNKVKVNPIILPEFSGGLLLNIKMDVHGLDGDSV